MVVGPNLQQLAGQEMAAEMEEAKANEFLANNSLSAQASAPLLRFGAPKGECPWPLMDQLYHSAPRLQATDRETRSWLECRDFLSDLSTIRCETCHGYGHNKRRCETRWKIAQRGKQSKI